MQEEFISSADGTKIFTRTWLPAGPAQAVLILVHGFNSHSGYYTSVGEQFSRLGLVVHALDLRGRGRSEGERFYIESFAEYLNDVDALVSMARHRSPGLPVYVLGHSAGGVISCVYTLEHQPELAGLICESFAFEVPAPDVALALLKGLSHIAPHAHVLRLDKAGFSRDPAMVERLRSDPLIGDEVQPTKTVAEMVRADERLRRDFPQFTLPVLILHGTADSVTKPSGSQLFYERASSADKTLKLYQGHFHDLLNDVGAQGVVDDIASWLTQRLSRSQAKAS